LRHAFVDGGILVALGLDNVPALLRATVTILPARSNCRPWSSSRRD